MTSASAHATTAAPGALVRSRRETVLLALALAAASAIALGFGRFGYALVLPAMREDLGWSYSAAGLLNTANALGYLAGAFSTGFVLRRFPNRVTLLAGLGAAAGSLALAGCVRSYWALLFCRALVGFAGAFTFISASGLAARLGRDEDENALAMGLTVAGPGFGTLATGLLVPFALGDSITHWPRAWLTMGALGGAVWLALFFVSRTFRTAPAPPGTSEPRPRPVKADFGSMRPVLLAYFLFGVGYIAYMTFLVAYVQSLKTDAGTIAMVWTLLGGAMVSSALVWRNELAKNTGGRTLALMGWGGALCALLPLLSSSLPVLLLSAAGFGLATMPVFTAVSMLIRRHLPEESWNSAIAQATVIFAVGQSLGPYLSGALSDRLGLTASLWWTAILLALAALVVSRQQPRQSRSPEN